MPITENEARRRFAEAVARVGVSTLIAELKVSRAYVSQVLNGKTSVGPRVQKYLGLRPVVMFVPENECDTLSQKGE